MSFATPVILSKPTKSASSLPHTLAHSAGDMGAPPTSAPSSATPSSSHSREPSLGPSVSQASSANGSNPTTPPPQTANGTGLDGATGEGNIASPNSNSSNSVPLSPAEADRQIIIEALKSKDRIYVLKLGEQMESLIKERRQRVEVTPITTYQRLLVHRCSAYYKLAPENDPATKSISVHPTSESRIPDVRICELVPPESSSQPAFKIMRRSPPDRLAKPHSQAGSVAGEDADLSDVEPSEAGSLGGRSNATGSSTKKHMTIEEREAAYKEARSRIFSDFEEKEKVKESQLSASSSSLSVNSTSASTSANGDTSSAGDVEACVSSPATESEWSAPSGPVHKERKDNRRGNASTSSSNRSVRSGGASYGSNNSSRNSRAPSPSFTYASLYEPPPPGQLYDPNQPTNPYQGTQYYHPFAPPAQPPGGMYVQYPYYPPYPYQAPAPDPHQAASDPSVPRTAEHYQHQPPPPVGYGGPYMWQAPAPAPPAPHSLPTSPHHTHPPATHSMSPPPLPAHQYSYPPYGYPAHGYYPQPPPPQGQSMPPPPQPAPGMQSPPYEIARAPGGPPAQPGGGATGTPPYLPYPPNGRNIVGNGAAPQQNTPRTSQRNQSLSSNGNNNGNKRNAPTSARNPWSYGSGIGPIGPGGYSSPSSAAGIDTVGPRLNPSRRQSNNSSSSSYSRASSINDDVSSIASSSTTSSSSRRTYTSTASSQHPLPPRPDWAVGLKAQPTLAREAGPRLTNGPISPSRSVNGSSQGMRKTPPLSLQPNDFPPLTPMATPQERRHVPNGAWGNVTNRSILSPGGSRSDDLERCVSERPSPKSAELYNPKLNRRVDASGLMKDGEAQPNLTEQLVNQIQSITIEEKIAAVELASSSSIVAADAPTSTVTGLLM